jgi:hypothetical protein
MKLTTAQAYELLAKYGIYVREACGRCGQLLGAVRFTRKGESGVWCSQECRDGTAARVPGTCKACRARLPEGKRRGTLYCDEACRKAAARSRSGELSRTKRPIYAGFRMHFRAGRHRALTAPLEVQNRTF